MKERTIKECILRWPKMKQNKRRATFQGAKMQMMRENKPGRGSGVQKNTSRSNRKHRCKGPKVSARNVRKAVWLECDEL